MFSSGYISQMQGNPWKSSVCMVLLTRSSSNRLWFSIAILDYQCLLSLGNQPGFCHLPCLSLPWIIIWVITYILVDNNIVAGFFAKYHVSWFCNLRSTNGCVFQMCWCSVVSIFVSLPPDRPIAWGWVQVTNAVASTAAHVGPQDRALMKGWSMATRGTSAMRTKIIVVTVCHSVASEKYPNLWWFQKLNFNPESSPHLRCLRCALVGTVETSSGKIIATMPFVRGLKAFQFIFVYLCGIIHHSAVFISSNFGSTSCFGMASEPWLWINIQDLNHWCLSSFTMNHPILAKFDTYLKFEHLFCCLLLCLVNQNLHLCILWLRLIGVSPIMSWSIQAPRYGGFHISINGGTPKWIVYKGKSYRRGDLGVRPF